MREITRLVTGMALGLFLLANPCFADWEELTIQKGVQWLIDSQNIEGYWGTETDMASKRFHITCEVANTFYCLGTTNMAYSTAIQWINGQGTTSSRALSRKIRPLAEYGSDTTKLIGTLTLSQNEDGGFGVNQGYGSDILDTLLALSALKSANYTNNIVIEPALWYLLSNQNPDGGWGFTQENGSSVYLTSLVLLTLNQYRTQYYLEESITKASNWLITKTPESLWEKAIMYSSVARQDLLEYILSNQQANGS
jgi:squalene cyclase